MSLIRLLYRSDSELTGSDRAVREAAFALADEAHARNTSIEVSGALMFAGGVFVQLLEGSSEAVESVFERICCDVRHRRLVLLDCSAIEQRVFGDRGMVAFEGDARARALFPTISEATPFTGRSRLSGNTAVELMLTLYTKRTTKPNRKPADRMIATDVMVSNVG